MPGEDPPELGKWGRFWRRNVVVLVMVPALVAMHWGWYKLQDVKEFVPEGQKKQIPIIQGLYFLEEKITGRPHRRE